MDKAPAYTVTARVLHWITAILVIGLIIVGLIIVNLPGGPLQDTLYNLHRSTGTILIPIVLYRLVYRLTHPPLPLPDDVEPLQRFVAGTVHWALYALLVIQPFVGWAATSAYPAPIIVYGLFELPPIVAENRALSEQLFTVHRWLGFLIAGLVCLHIGGALFHQLVRRDRVLMRMVTG